MKKTKLFNRQQVTKRNLFVVSLCCSFFSFQQMSAQNVGINTTGATPNASSMLDLNTGNTYTSPNGKGLLIPNVALASSTDATTIASPATSLLVYVPTGSGLTPAGYYYNSGTTTSPIWLQLATGGGGGGNSWLLLGNAGTVDGTNFIGTTDNVPLNFRINNRTAGRIENNATTANTFLGFQSGNSNGAGYNTGIGYESLYSNTTGVANVAIGYDALYFSQDGHFDVAIGYDALYNNKVNACNAIGYDALYANVNGYDNNAVGYLALNSNTNGGQNNAFGTLALMNNITGNNNIGIGAGAGPNSGGLNFTNAFGDGAITTASYSTEIGDTVVHFCGINGAFYNVGYALRVGINATNGNGAYLTKGGVWTNTSDRNKKENFITVNGEDILNKINELPITRWNYKGEPASIQHIGPMAQDFYRIFHIGNDSLSISTIDPSGIALVGIKELIAKNESLKLQVQSLKLENQQQQQTNDKMQTQISNLSSQISVINSKLGMGLEAKK